MATITIPKSELLDMEKQISDLKKELAAKMEYIASLEALVKGKQVALDVPEGIILFNNILTLQAVTLYLETGLELAKLKKEEGIDLIEKNLIDSRSRLDGAMKEYEEFSRVKPAVAKFLTKGHTFRLSKKHAGVD
jgi:hypothetical protein